VIVFLGIVVVSALIDTIVIVVKSKSFSNRLLLWLQGGNIVRVALIIVSIILGIPEEEEQKKGHVERQSFYAIIEAVVFGILSIILLGVDILLHRRHERQDLSKKRRSLLQAIITVFFFLIIFAVIFTFIESWTFEEAWIFINVTALTIGYGNITVKTTAGKITLCILGWFLLASVAYFLIHVRDYTTPVVNRYIFICVVIVYWFIGALMFMLLEGWTFIDALYFTWTTLTTIGYGDLTPTNAAAWEFWMYYVYVAIAQFAVIIGMLADTLIAANARRVGNENEESGD
jgi:hypothetical protein